MKRTTVFRATVILFALLGAGGLHAHPVGKYEAVMAVTGWLKADPQPLNLPMGRSPSGVETFTDEVGQPLYYVVSLNPSGFVIVPCDDRIEPILGFTHEGTYDPSPTGTLAALVTNDVRHRLITEIAWDGLTSLDRGSDTLTIASTDTAETDVQKKWRRYIELADTPVDQLSIAGLTAGYMDDLRVAPLLKTRWDQQTCHVEQHDGKRNTYVVDRGVACYNFYTPPGEPGDPNNFPCGCVATAMAQLMRYHQWPDEGVGRQEFGVQVKQGDQWQSEKAWALGGDGLGGPYDWAHMQETPDGSDAETCKAIGALCHDAGISLGMNYAPEGSDPPNALSISAAMTDTFGYTNAVVGVKWQNSSAANLGSNLTRMINPNLDAAMPVVLLIRDAKEQAGHAVLCDGYGFEDSTPYYHLNMGESKSVSGCLDLWYQLIWPDIHHTCTSSWWEDDPDGQSSTRYTQITTWSYDTVSGCVYNVFPQELGEIISGRVLDANGVPMANAAVVAETLDKTHVIQDVSDPQGIYALVGCKPETEYTIRVEIPGRYFPSETVKSGISMDASPTCGNTWGVVLREDYPHGWLFYVDPNAPKDPNVHQDGSAENPFDTIREAIEACGSGDTVILRPGIHRGPGNRNLRFAGKAITVRSLDPNDPNIVEATIIDCENTARALNFLDGEKRSSVLAGVTIRNGHATYGGAMVIANESGPLLLNVIFHDNCIGTESAVEDSEPNLVRRFFEGEFAEGGAVYIYGSSPVFRNCTFSSNSNLGNASLDKYRNNGGGAVWVNLGSPTFINCRFLSNTVNTRGRTAGALGVVTGQATLVNCTFFDNLASYGSAMSALGYWAKRLVPGGYIDIRMPANIEAVNCTFSRNHTHDPTGPGPSVEAEDLQGFIRLTNCILWGNAHDGDGANSISYSVTRRAGEGNIDVDPLFVDANRGDLRLRPESPCIDAGDPDFVVRWDDADPAGNPRVADGNSDGISVVDMGAYELPGQ